MGGTQRTLYSTVPKLIRMSCSSKHGTFCTNLEPQLIYQNRLVVTNLIRFVFPRKNEPVLRFSGLETLPGFGYAERKISLESTRLR